MTHQTVAELLADLIDPNPNFSTAAKPAISAIDPAQKDSLLPASLCESVRFASLTDAQPQAGGFPSPEIAAGCLADKGRHHEARQSESQESQESQPTPAHDSSTAVRWDSDGTWDDADIRRFMDRRARLMRWGWTETQAEALAERLVRRDLASDERTMCTECLHYKPGRCSTPSRAQLNHGSIGRDWAVLLQRCPGFAPNCSQGGPEVAPPG
jgi:hypothetical protein